jgi:hypothetical protein
VKAVCEKHGVPYVQEPLPQRLKQLLGVIVGTKKMQTSRTRSRQERVAARADLAATG